MAQEYLPAVTKGDKRVLLLNGRVLGVQLRIPHKEDHRANISAGGSSQKGTLTPQEKALAQEVGARLTAEGIYFAGIDIIGGKLTEVNITSPTGLVWMNIHEQEKLERRVIDFIEEKCATLAHNAGAAPPQ